MTNPDYAFGEALVLTQLRSVSGFTSANTSRNNWAILNSGKAAVYAIVRKGAWEMEWQSYTVARFAWQTVIELWQQWTQDDAATRAALDANEALVLARFLAYHRLGDTAGRVQDSTPRRADEPEVMFDAARNTAAFLRASIVIEWQEVAEIAFAEE